MSRCCGGSSNCFNEKERCVSGDNSDFEKAKCVTEKSYGDSDALRKQLNELFTLVKEESNMNRKKFLDLKEESYVNRKHFVDLNKKFEKLDSKLEVIASITQSEAAETQKQITLIQKQQQKCESMVKQIKAGLGLNFEKFNISWIQQVFKDLGYQTLDIQQGRTFHDPDYLVNAKNDRFEVDIYNEKPLIIGECTTYLESDEIKKVEKLVAMKYFEKKVLLMNLKKIINIR